MNLKNSNKTEEKVQNAGRKNLEFLATVSHEIRNPINAIVGLSELIKKSPFEKEREIYLDNLVESCRNLMELVNNIMDFSKLESGIVGPTLKPTELNKVIQKKISGYKTIAESKGLQFIYDFDQRIPEWVLIDQVKLAQVILNLVSNAVKFTHKGSIIVGVELEKVESGRGVVKFYVRDSGIGIPEDKLDSIFEAFQQGGDEINQAFGGTGLGLSISKQIVKMLGGELKVESRQGEGSKFTFFLELDFVPESQNQPINLSEIKSRQKKDLKLLIVDDDKLNILVLEKQLESWGFESRVAFDGLSATRVIQEEEFDMVLMDFHMPHLDGLSATEAIRNMPKRNFKELPIIGLSASTELFLEEKIKTSGFTDFVSKPFSPAELLDKILLHSGELEEKV